MFNLFFSVLDTVHVFKDTIKVGNTGKYVFIDSRETPDHGYESMAFESDEKGNVLSWGELDVSTYDTWEDMLEGHEKMCEEWKKKEVFKGIYDD